MRCALKKRFIVSVLDVTGECHPGYKKGDTFEFSGLQTPAGGFCGGAYHAMFPILFLLQFGGHYPLSDVESEASISCPDRGKVQFHIRLVEC
jgi:uncharacterized repeat protein (TIGR04076 family)